MVVMPAAGALQILVPGFWQGQQDELLINAVVIWLGDHLLGQVHGNSWDVCLQVP